MAKNCSRMERILAFLIDFMLIYPLCFLSTYIVRLSFLGNAAVLITTIALMVSLVLFILRDYLLDGRSIGKRLCKLAVLDADTLTIPSTKQLIVRNLFLFLGLLDGLFLLLSGRSLSERATHTVVLREQPPSGGLGIPVKKRAAVAIAVALAISIPMFLAISTSLDAVKEQENYRLAHSYLMDSQAYAETQADESQIILTGYSASTSVDSDGDTVSAVVTFSFLVQGQQYQVVCHQDGDMWYVCGDCTDFR